ncbi:PREDICTED: uncharacterized protein LOC106339050 [Brassica oleracea var. oleracea]|uniref:uncharacterized protein LOC106339050 n=1 Tax=Brassica oleracea var. oleracea TaxID=109376 RepID=UPI0006A70019|nr:PREDICTED: uncharacterized protein LOC106339050 [Brassica oleracea var. oleracea]
MWKVDFNQVSSPSEHSAPPSLNVDAHSRVFNNCLLDSGLSDLNYGGNLFTWWNKQKSAPVAKKLDRILVNDSWSDLFPNSVAFFDSPDFPDHASMKVVLNSQLVSKKRPFKFFNFLLQNPTFLSMWNATSLVLIPKITNASRTTDFRPISCLNTLYKVLSKLLAGRLKTILPSVISNAQSAFLPGRLLAENVLLATDLVKGYNSQVSEPRAMLKVDIRKAFDTVRWDFIITALRALSIPEKFVMWIKECITTPSFSVSVNGVSGGYFRSTRGVRQGDPLSPYIFVLAMEALSRLLHSRFQAGWISYHPKTDRASDISSHDSAAISRFGFSSGSLPIRYLGLPLMSRKLKISEYAPLIAKIFARFKMWATRTLSFAGRLQLLSTVIAGTVNFWISCFILPKGCIKQIESLCIRFLWSGNIELCKSAKVAWSTVCLPKDEGGLGLRNFMVWNQVMCLRFIWLLFSDKPSLWADWHRYYSLSQKCFWAVEETQHDSWMWKRLLKLRPVALLFLRVNLGNGSKIKFWYDIWTPLGQLIVHIGENGPRNTRIPINAIVSQAANATGWCVGGPHSQRELDLHIHLTTLSFPATSVNEDEFFWEADGISDGSFSAAHTWEVLRPRETKK